MEMDATASGNTNYQFTSMFDQASSMMDGWRDMNLNITPDMFSSGLMNTYNVNKYRPPAL